MTEDCVLIVVAVIFFCAVNGENQVYREYFAKL